MTSVVDRRQFVLTSLVGAFVAPVVAAAQQAAKVARIGLVSTNVVGNRHLIEAFRQGLQDLGYVEGRNLMIEYRSAEGKLDRFPALVTELAALKVDVIVATNTQAALAARQATATIPIVFAGPADPVSSGLVTSLSRPGGNVTGLSSVPASQLAGKPLELLMQAVPGRTRFAALWHRDYPAHTQQDILGAVESAARALGVHVQFVEAHGGPESFPRAFTEIIAARAEALTVLSSVLFISERRRLVGLAAKHRLPAVYVVRDFVDDGGLMSYGPLWIDLFRRAAIYVDKILKGLTPSELPVEQPTTFELVINLKTAKALGLTIPPSLLARADQVIE